MKISVFGTGYVGLVTGLCFAEMGNSVTCADIDEGKIRLLKQGQSPIYEPGLEEMLKANTEAKRIQFTTDLREAVEKSDLLFIAVGTPSDKDGSADLRYVYDVASVIGKHMSGYKLIVNKSTVPVGTHLKISEILRKTLRERGVSVDFDVASNPEFLREGCALEDCLYPDRVVVGVSSEKAKGLLQDLYEPFLKSGNPFIAMDPFSSEMTKYAANAMLAAKISLMNEFSRLCERVGADIEHVRKGIGSDQRIGPHFIYAGVGYGGSCFPKDVKALVHLGHEYDESLTILKSVEDANLKQRQNFFAKIMKIKGGLSGKKLAFWGVAFKPGTDDVRDAPALDLIEWCVKEGAQVCAYDPVASKNAFRVLESHLGGASERIRFFDDQYGALDGADAIVICTEWKSFREPDFEKIKSLMKMTTVFDGRNIYSPKRMREAGIEYYSIGRPS